MWLFKFKKRNKERDLAKIKEIEDAAFNAGLTFGKKLRIEERIKSINSYGSKQPKHVFGIIILFLAGSIVINLTWRPFKNSLIAPVAIPTTNVNPFQNDGKKLLEIQMDSLHKELDSLTNRAEEYFNKESLDHKDSLELYNTIQRIESISNIIGYKDDKQTNDIKDQL